MPVDWFVFYGLSPLWVTESRNIFLVIGVYLHYAIPWHLPCIYQPIWHRKLCFSILPPKYTRSFICRSSVLISVLYFPDNSCHSPWEVAKTFQIQPKDGSQTFLWRNFFSVARKAYLNSTFPNVMLLVTSLMTSGLSDRKKLLLTQENSNVRNN